METTTGALTKCWWDETPCKILPGQSLERDFAIALGREWMSLGQDREVWSALKEQWIRQTDQPWSRGRQLALVHE